MDAQLALINALLGGGISQLCEQGAFFQDPKQSDMKKFLAAMGLCVIASLAVTLLSLNAAPSGYLAWRDLLEGAVVAAVSSQAWHEAALKWFSAGKTLTVTQTATTSSADGTVTTEVKADVPTDLRTTPPLGVPLSTADEQARQIAASVPKA